MNDMRFRGTAALVTLAALVTCTAAAAGSAQDPGKGGGSPPVTLTFANSDPSLFGIPAVQRFIDRVKQLSDGKVRIKVSSSWGNGAPGYELGVLRDVRQGKADLGWLGTRVFDRAGVKTFQALHAPMLVDSYALEKAILRSPLPAKMLTGLERIDLVGLAVLGDRLRRPVGTKRSLVKPSDYVGITFRTYSSDVQERAIRALGARTSDLGWADLRAALSAGKVQGMETDLQVYTDAGYAEIAPYVTANVALWPRTAALVANAAAFENLTAKQRGWITRASADAAAYSLARLDGDSRELAMSCRAGAKVAVASQKELTALRKAWTPLYESIEQNSATKSFVNTIQTLKQSTNPERLSVPSGCFSKTGADTPTSGSKRDPKVLNGVYRVGWTEEELLAAGANGDYAANNAGLLTMTLRNGQLRLHYSTPGGDCLGKYSVSGAMVSLTLQVNCHGVTRARWKLKGGKLRLEVSTATDPGDRFLFGGKPWVKIR